MSVVGIDLGNVNSLVATVKNRNIEVVLNEVSNRTTPSLVGFSQKARFIGEAAKSNEISNLKNTINSLKRLIGLSFNDPDVQLEKGFVTADLVDHNGVVGASIMYRGERHVFTVTQLVGMLLGQLREVAHNATNLHISDVVLSVPAYFTDQQRRALLDATEIAGLNCLKLMNETTAAALEYGINRTDLPEDKPRHVCFVDLGHSAYTVAIGAFQKGKLDIKSVACDKHIGGRNFDEVLVDHFSKEIFAKFNVDIKKSPKGLFRLRTACERVKKVLSANPVTMMNVESIMEDRDFTTEIQRKTFEDLSAHLLAGIEKQLSIALQSANLTIDQIDSIEVVGGCSRVPAIKERICKFFGREISTTMNQDEAVARGCALQCAILSPSFKVRDFSVHDISIYPIKLSYEPTTDAPEDCEVEIFQANSTYPATRMLTFYRSEPFDVEMKYSTPEHGTNAWIGRCTIQKVAPNADGSAATIKVKVKMNIHGTVQIEGAQVYEEQPVDEATMDVEAANETVETVKGGSEDGVKKKKLVKKIDIPIFSGTSSLSSETISTLRGLESDMFMTDKLVADTADRKNALEECIYDIKGKLDGILAEYVIDADKNQLMKILSETEEWLYGDGEDATKGVYVEKIDYLQKFGKPLTDRYKEYEDVPIAAQSLRDVAKDFINKSTSNDPRFDHISVDEKNAIVEECKRMIKWADVVVSECMAAPKHLKCPHTPLSIANERSALVQMATPILTRPKPAPPAIPKEAANEINPTSEESKADGVPNMDVD